MQAGAQQHHILPEQSWLPPAWPREFYGSATVAALDRAAGPPDFTPEAFGKVALRPFHRLQVNVRAHFSLVAISKPKN